MKQLSRYARAVFAHQLHRRHLYAMMVCNTEATFVRFDRAGILYSHRIDLRTDSKAFTYVFAYLGNAGLHVYDLESFFWLVLWSAAAHLDPGRPITPHAQLLLNRLNQTDFFSLRSEKAATLFNCYMQDGKDMLDLLELIDNEWATHPIFVDVIIEFVDVFPAVVRIFQDALASNDD
ncbi:hypothetical protein FRC11_001720 [Ceratobasidium sp. 423]|nr:hypothetical protein FRC11_001720 [Ceratobasidium sp. 423]